MKANELTANNIKNLAYMSEYILRDIIKEFAKNEDISKFNKQNLIDKIVELSKIEVKINNKIEQRVFLPENIDLPFFAYGIFKPNQIAYHVIKDLVESSENKSIDKYHQFLRDGLSFIISDKNFHDLNGYKINFKSEKALEAYFKISNKEPRNLYKWEVIENMNALVATDKIGIDKEFHGDPDNIIGWNDPYFHIGLEVITQQKFDNENMNYRVNSNWNDKGFFAEMIFVQMKFLLAYSMLERLAFLMTSFQSGSNQVSAVLADNSFVQAAILKLYNELHEKVQCEQREVYSTERKSTSKGEKVIFSFKDSIEQKDFKKIIKFYYQIRNNITHRGKSLGRVSDNFKTYLEELTLIVKYTLEYGQHLNNKL
jgi:hypothetical protein